ncbi:MAG: UDP-N-acetylglucosamine 2-epimerase, partial [Chitinophagaceae bacterium]
SFALPVVNIGTRQDGRLKPVNVIDSSPVKKNLAASFNKALSDSFKKSCKAKNPYGKGEAAAGILKQISKIGKLNSTKKKFYDLGHD